DTLPHTAALARLRQVKAPEVAPLVISRWTQFTPSLRSKLMPLLLERESWTAELVKAIKQGAISPAEISLEQRKRLPNLFAEPADRAGAWQKYKSVASLKPEPARGAELFDKNCATCHALGERGFAVGPNLAEFAGK